MSVQAVAAAKYIERGFIMATYRTSDLLKLIHELGEDDIDYIDIFQHEDEEENLTWLHIDGIVDEFERIGYDSLESVEDIDNDSTDYICNPDAPCTLFTFTYNEIFTFARAIDSALEFYKLRSAASNCSREERDALKKHSIAMRNLQAKLSKKIKRSYD